MAISSSYGVHVLRWMPLTACVLAAAWPSAGCEPYVHERSGAGVESYCPEGAQWDGVRCVQTEVACPDGSSWSGGRCVADVTSVSALPDTLVGTWSVAGARPGGQPYVGQATISAVAPPPGAPASADRPYRITWNVGGSVYAGVGVRHGEFLSVGWSDDDEHGVASYLAPGDGTLDGVWFDARTNAPGKELLSGGTPSLAGVYTITAGVAPGGTPYTGTCDLVVTGDLHTLVWHVGKDDLRGLGLRAGELLSVGFSTAKSGNFGVVQYRVSGDRLIGRWAEWSQSSPVAGTEVLSRG